MRYGTCVDCGGESYTRWRGDELCRSCHEDRCGFKARNPWVRANIVQLFAEQAPPAFYTEEQVRAFEARSPERERKRQRIQENLAAYARGEFAGHLSLVSGQ